MAGELEQLEDLYRSADGTSRFRKFPDGTPDPSKYHNVSDIHFLGSNGSSIAHFLPGNHGFSGLRGVVIPRSRPEGGSMGFDPYQPQRCFIDPELTGKKIQVDFSQLTKGKINQAFSLANKQMPSDLQDRAVVMYVLMAEASKNATAAASRPRQVITSTQPATFVKEAMPLPAIPVPLPEPVMLKPAPSLPSSPPVHMESSSPVMRPVSILQDVRSPVPLSSTRKSDMAQQPLRKVVFELPRPVGMFQAYYHDVARTEDLLILVYDHSQGNTQHVWFPAAPDPEEEPVPLGVLVHDLEGEPDTGFIAYATAARFSYKGLEFCLLSIEKEKSYKKEVLRGDPNIPPPV